MNKTFDFLVELRNRGALLLSVGVSGVVITAIALYAYGLRAPVAFPNAWTSIVIALVGSLAVAAYAAINLVSLRNQQRTKRDLVHTPLPRVLAPLGLFLVAVTITASVYKHSAINSARVVQASHAQLRNSQALSEDELLRACKFARMKDYMGRGYSLLDADKAAYLECATSKDKTALFIQSVTGKASISATSADVGGHGDTSGLTLGRGALQNATATEWADANASDRLATSVDFVVAVGGASGSHDVQLRATELNACITEAVSGSHLPNLMTKDVAAACMAMLGYR